MTHFTPTVSMPDTCPECGAMGRRMTRYVCSPCYLKHYRAGTTDQLQRRTPLKREHKPCGQCHQIKHFSEFAKQTRGMEGVSSYCKVCLRKNRESKPKALRPPDDGTTKYACRLCLKEKDSSAFYWRPESGKYRAECSQCISERDRSRRSDPASSYHSRRRDNLMKQYGLSHERYLAILAEQGGACAICGRADNPDGGHLAVDHCHSTGQVRGILCGPCNKAIGLFSDSPDLLLRGAEYLNR